MMTPLDQRSRSAPYSGLNITSAKRFLMAQFREAGLESPDLDARILIMAATGFSHTELVMRGQDVCAPEVHDLIAEYAERRLGGEPVDHIIGYREFYGHRFKVTKDVLSPRPETEMIVDEALKILESKLEARILDLGTGSGAIIVSILSGAHKAQAAAVDMSAAALLVAQENAKMHGVDDRIVFLEGSWFEPVQGGFDIIVSNPPYITHEAMDELEDEVSGFDPDLALRGGKDGLTAYRAIIGEVTNFLNPDGILLLEIGYDQGPSVSHLLNRAHMSSISVLKDLSGHDRMIKADYIS